MVRVGLLGWMVGILAVAPTMGWRSTRTHRRACRRTQEDEQGSEEDDPNDEVDPEIAEAFEDAIIRIVSPVWRIPPLR